jgi:GNAT superfamily N-acetyltransferase
MPEQNRLPPPAGESAKPSPSRIRLLERSDIPGAMLLKEQAGWNQTGQDWERLLELEPHGCFALETEGCLAATASVLVYGEDLAWIGMVLTAPRYRGRGFASMLVNRTIEFAESRKVAHIGLDATDMGIPVYRSCGFEGDCPVERWERPPLAEPAAPLELAGWRYSADLDTAAFGTDRSKLLASLARVEAASIPGLGYAMGRPGSKAAYFGPCVARSNEAAARLLRWFSARHAGEQVYWDLPAENRAAVQLARQSGFRRVRQLIRMWRHREPGGTVNSPDLSSVFAIAGFEYG